jgi:hypothetical protein
MHSKMVVWAPSIDELERRAVGKTLLELPGKITLHEITNTRLK